VLIRIISKSLFKTNHERGALKTTYQQEESELMAKDDQLDDGKDEEEQGDQSEFNPNER